MYCKQCGYDLRACLENRCSECGRKFDPADPKTFTMRPPHERRRWWIKRGLAALLTVLILLSGAWGWLYWEWREEQQALAKLQCFWVAESGYIGPDWLSNYLGPAGFVLERVREMVPRNGVQVNNDQLVPLKGVKWLKKLNLRTLQVSDLTPLAKLTALQYLDFSFTNVSDLSPLSKLTALQELGLSGTLVSDLSPLFNLTSLARLYFDDTPVSNLSPLSNLTALQIINSWNTKVSDLSPLSKLTALHDLDVPKKTVPEAQVQELQRALPNCRILRF
jgi:rRNA maturation protein Nop10